MNNIENRLNELQYYLENNYPDLRESVSKVLEDAVNEIEWLNQELHKARK